MRRDRRLLLAALLFFVLIGASGGCSAGSPSQVPPTVENAEAGDIAAHEAAATPEADDADDSTDNCDGILSCTFFGLGAVIAAPFWVLGAVLGLAF